MERLIYVKGHDDRKRDEKVQNLIKDWQQLLMKQANSSTEDRQVITNKKAFQMFQ